MLASHQVVKVNTPGNFTKFKSIQKDIGLVETKTLDTAVYKLHETIKLWIAFEPFGFCTYKLNLKNQKSQNIRWCKTWSMWWYKSKKWKKGNE